ncbi:MAG: N-6 DNA methylase [Bacteroidota bacterium]
MSEEIIKRGYKESGVKVGKYQYYDIGDSTLTQLKKYQIIPRKKYGEYSRKKPDGLLVDRRNKNKIDVIAVVEHKQPTSFKSDKQKKSAVEQCNDICQELDANIGIISDGITTIWINPKKGKDENNYVDGKDNERSYTLIKDEDGKEVQERFYINLEDCIDLEKADDDTQNTIFLIERILDSVGKNSSKLERSEQVDPMPLARSVWQDIYINTGKHPTKCLYNVVELFIYKFISDLGLLDPPYSFEYLLNLYKKNGNADNVLKTYAKSVRGEIIDLFPESPKDGTTIINGTIFVTPQGEPVLSQSTLFVNSLQKFDNFGSLKNVKKDFKTKLFENFLKQSQDKSKLGQFFTPRKVVRAIVEMADVENLSEGSRFCDPFCGVGGFLLEPLHYANRKRDFVPKNNKIKPSITYEGYDKGSDDDEERTIILAKANMLIYLSEIIEKNKTLTQKFAKEVFNKTFELITDSNLGTLKKIQREEENKYDLILTNPPYVTSGVKSLKNEIDAEGLDNYYVAGGLGTSGLALEWIVRNLKKGGRAFVILNDTIFNVKKNKSLRDFVLKNCYVNCLISLPVKTFFNTPKKTFILGITKKQNPEDSQEFPVFTYLVSDIGETLDANRFEKPGKSDLEKATNLYKYYRSNPKNFDSLDFDDKRCKVQEISKFKDNYWDIDRWWSQDEKVDLGIEEEVEIINVDEFESEISDLASKLEDYQQELIKLNKKTIGEYESKEVSLGNDDIFEIDNGKRIRKKDIEKAKGDIPVYSSSKYADECLGKVSDEIEEIVSGAQKFEGPCLTVNADGSVGKVFYREGEFYANDILNVIKTEDENINYKYLLYELQNKLSLLGLSWSNKLYKGKLKTVIVDIPVDDEGNFNLDIQKSIASRYDKIQKIKNKITSLSEKISNYEVNIISGQG